MKFERDLNYQKKLFLQGIDGKQVIIDAKIEIVRDFQKHKYRAWCPKVGTYIQFPNSLREHGKNYIADIIEVPGKNKRTFYRVVKGSIRLVKKITHTEEELVG